MGTPLNFDIEPDELDLFLRDVNEYLQTAESGILHLEQSQELDTDTLNTIFRAAHTLKAVAATIGHHRMTALTHAMETLFDRMREGEIALSAALIDSLLAAVDVLKILRDEVASQEAGDVDVETLRQKIQTLASQPPENQTSGEKSPGVVSTTSPAPETRHTIAISIERLDSLMNLVGELVTDRTRLVQIEEILRTGDDKKTATTSLTELSIHLERIIGQLQQEVMQIRMLPISSLFSRFPRLVRDMAHRSGKQVNLMIEGEATELDRSIIEVMRDPLIHILRNAVDHGIEIPANRLADGKGQSGNIWLTAAHEEGHMIITVRDDGQGINPDKLREKLVRKQIFSREDAIQLDDDAAISFIFQPGLSTATHVTELSGRGVGLDAVLARIQSVNGSIEVDSQVGTGTTFRIMLPLTLAILQTLMVGLGDDIYAIPLPGVIETVYLSDVVMNSVSGRNVMQWREQVLPLIYMRDFFAHPGLSAPHVNDKPAIVVTAWGKKQMGLVVDRLIGKQEVVIKSLSSLIGNIAGISGCAILGSGQAVLIADIPGIINTTIRNQEFAPSMV